MRRLWVLGCVACAPAGPTVEDVCRAVLTCGGQGFADRDSCEASLLVAGCGDEAGYLACATACGEVPCDAFPACEAGCFQEHCFVAVDTGASRP